MQLIKDDKRLNAAPLVSVFCNTFNQVSYIAKCLDSFLAQKTNFPIEVLVTDDASTDGTAEIVADYAESHPDTFIAILHEENQYSKGVNHNREFLWPLSRGKFIAFCEGDDWWSDPLKLQKQYDKMLATPTASWCVHASDYVDEKGRLLYVSRLYESDSLLEFTEACQRIQLAATASFFVRKEVYGRYLDAAPSKMCCHGDFKMSRFFSLFGDTIYLSESMSAYRCFAHGSINSEIAIRPDWRDIVKRNTESRIDYLENLILWAGEDHRSEVENQIELIEYVGAIDLRDRKKLHGRFPDRFASESVMLRTMVELFGRHPRLEDSFRRIRHRYFRYMGMRK